MQPVQMAVYPTKAGRKVQLAPLLMGSQEVSKKFKRQERKMTRRNTMRRRRKRQWLLRVRRLPRNAKGVHHKVLVVVGLLVKLLLGNFGTNL